MNEEAEGGGDGERWSLINCVSCWTHIQLVSVLLSSSLRRLMFGLSLRLPVSVSGAAGSSDSAGGAAGPSRVQPSACDTLSVTDPLLPAPPASGLFSAVVQSVSQSVFTPGTLWSSSTR